jgi:hypothetical protein
MGYWKREYTERKNGKPLFAPEAKHLRPAEEPEPNVEPQQPEEDQADEAPTNRSYSSRTIR